MTWWLLLAVPLAVVLGYGWAWVELVVASPLGWFICAAVVAGVLTLGSRYA